MASGTKNTNAERLRAALPVIAQALRDEGRRDEGVRSLIMDEAADIVENLKPS